MPKGPGGKAGVPAMLAALAAACRTIARQRTAGMWLTGSDV
jgi:hypothetical protein